MKNYLTKSIFVLFALAAASFLFTSCASIVSDSIYPMRVESEPPGADVKIKNRYGSVMYSGKTPTVFQIDVSEGFSRKPTIQLRFLWTDTKNAFTLSPFLSTVGTSEISCWEASWEW